ncbi:hypothetical protein D3C80_1091910 [compost metagenome]
MEDAGAAVAVKRLQDDIPQLVTEGGNFFRITRDQRRRHQVGEFGDEDLFRRVAHPGWIVNDKRLRVDALQKMGRGDIAHVEWRILTQKHDVHLREIHTLPFAEGEMIALDVAHLQWLDGRKDLAVAHGQTVGRVVEKLVATGLGLQGHCEGGIASDVDAGNMVHLDCDLANMRHEFRPR